MVALVDAITNGADRCGYAALNSNLMVWSEGEEGGSSYISNELPGYCRNYYENSYTNAKAPRYVGIPGQGGFWVE
jgi:hypothetical protein